MSARCGLPSNLAIGAVGLFRDVPEFYFTWVELCLLSVCFDVSWPWTGTWAGCSSWAVIVLAACCWSCWTCSIGSFCLLWWEDFLELWSGSVGTSCCCDGACLGDLQLRLHQC